MTTELTGMVSAKLKRKVKKDENPTDCTIYL